MVLPGSPVDASIWRTPHQSGQFSQVLALTLRRFMGVLFQPERQFQFQQTQGAVSFKRLIAFAEWPDGVSDPQPIHSGDQLHVLFDEPVEAIVQAGPAPTTTACYVQAGAGAGYIVGQPITIGTQAAILQSITGDQLTYTQPNGQPLATAPSPGAVVTEVGQVYTVDDADCYEGHHIEIYLRVVPRNA